MKKVIFTAVLAALVLTGCASYKYELYTDGKYVGDSLGQYGEDLDRIMGTQPHTNLVWKKINEDGKVEWQDVVRTNYPASDDPHEQMVVGEHNADGDKIVGTYYDYNYSVNVALGHGANTFIMRKSNGEWLWTRKAYDEEQERLRQEEEKRRKQEEDDAYWSTLNSVITSTVVVTGGR